MTIWPNTVDLDGFDLGQLGFVLETPSGWGDYMQWRETLAHVADRPDAVSVSNPQARERLIVLRGTVNGDSRVELISNRDEIWWRLRGGGINGTGKPYRQIAFADDKTRVFRAMLAESAQLPTVPPSLTQFTIQAQIPLTCPDPRIFASTDTVVAFTTATALPLWSEASSAKVEVDVATFTITYKDSAGTTIWTIGVNGAANPPITLHLGYDGVINALNSLGVSVLGNLTAGSRLAGRLFDPQHGDITVPSWPTIETDLGNGTATYPKNAG